MAGARACCAAGAAVLLVLLGSSALLASAQQLSGLTNPTATRKRSSTPKTSVGTKPSGKRRSPKPSTSPLPTSPKPRGKKSPTAGNPTSPKPAPSQRPTSSPRPKIKALPPRAPTELPLLVQYKPGYKASLVSALSALGYKVKPEVLGRLPVSVPYNIGLNVVHGSQVSAAGITAVTRTALAAIANIPGVQSVRKDIIVSLAATKIAPLTQPEAGGPLTCLADTTMQVQPAAPARYSAYLRKAAAACRNACSMEPPKDDTPPAATDSNSTTTPGYNPDGSIGTLPQTLPYGVRMVQADMPEALDAATKVKEAVVYCLIDSGVHQAHPDLQGVAMSGCWQNQQDMITSIGNCNNTWNSDVFSHGTLMAGIIGALHNTQGVVGVAPLGASMHFVNPFDPAGNGSTSGMDIIHAIQVCYFEKKKLQAANPAVKMVVSLAVSGAYDESEPGAAEVMARINEFVDTLFLEGDMIFMAAAGNSGDETPHFPAMMNSVMGVTEVNNVYQVASSACFNSDVDFAAPGTDVLSTSSPSVTDPQVRAALMGRPLLALVPRVNNLSLEDPIPTPLYGSPFGTVYGMVVDCRNGDDACPMASGRICLIEADGSRPLCQKLETCAASGGRAALVYNSLAANATSCATLGIFSLYTQECWDKAVHVPALGLSYQQGATLAKALWYQQVWARMSFEPYTEQYGYLSGTSPATSYASGVAGLVWAANPSCSNSEILDALKVSALQLPAAEDQAKAGAGLLQAAAALKYLQAKPCTGVCTPIAPK